MTCHVRTTRYVGLRSNRQGQQACRGLAQGGPHKQGKGTQAVLEQAEVLFEGWAGERQSRLER